MESSEYNSDASWDIFRIFRNFNKNNTSSENLSFGTVDTGIRDIPEKEASTIRPVTLKTVKFPIKKNVLDSPHLDTIPLKLNLKFSIEVENLIMRDLTFRKFISEIERSLNEFIKLENVGLENRIFFEEDWEIPNYKKLVLSLNFKGIPFKLEMSLWKMINSITYKRIKSMIPYSSEEQIRRIKDLKKKFFIKLEM